MFQTLKQIHQESLYDEEKCNPAQLSAPVQETSKYEIKRVRVNKLPKLDDAFIIQQIMNQLSKIEQMPQKNQMNDGAQYSLEAPTAENVDYGISIELLVNKLLF